MHKSLRNILPIGAAVLLAFSTAAAAKTVTLGGDFVTEHGATNQASGHVKATLDTVTHKLKYTIEYKDFTGPITIAHFHGPAAAGVDAGVMKAIPGPYQSGMSNAVTIDAATQSAMLDGLTYVNLHTKQYPKGEARAQMKVSESPGM